MTRELLEGLSRFKSEYISRHAEEFRTLVSEGQHPRRQLAAALFVTATMVSAAPQAQAAEAFNSPASVQQISAEAEAPSSVLTVGAFMEKSSEEKADFVMAVIDHVLDGLISPYHNGERKPEAVRQEHLRMAYFIDDLFFNEDKNGNVTVNERPLNDLLLYFRGINMDDPQFPAHRVVGLFLSNEYEKYKAKQ